VATRPGKGWSGPGGTRGDSGDRRLAAGRPARVDAVGFVFIAMVWANHHRLMRYATTATARRTWVNFAHLFCVSLVPLSTPWRAVRERAPPSRGRCPRRSSGEGDLRPADPEARGPSCRPRRHAGGPPDHADRSLVTFVSIRRRCDRRAATHPLVGLGTCVGCWWCLRGRRLRSRDADGSFRLAIGLGPADASRASLTPFASGTHDWDPVRSSGRAYSDADGSTIEPTRSSRSRGRLHSVAETSVGVTTLS